MDLICNNCGAIFDINEAEVEEYDIEEDLGVGDMFPDHHTGHCFVCPECRSDEVEEYHEKEAEEDEEEE